MEATMNEVFAPHVEGVVFSRVGISLPDDLPFETWGALIEEVFALEQSHRWWLGDLLNFGERAYGEKYAAMVDLTGLSYDTLCAYAFVAGGVPIGIRTELLSWTHHKWVASPKMPVVEKRRWLALAVDRGLSSYELRDAIQAAQSGQPTPAAERVVDDEIDETITPAAERIADAEQEELTWVFERERACIADYTAAARAAMGSDNFFAIDDIEQLVNLSTSIAPPKLFVSVSSDDQVDALIALTVRYCDAQLHSAACVFDGRLNDAMIRYALSLGALICSTDETNVVYIGRERDRFFDAFEPLGVILTRYT